MNISALVRNTVVAGAILAMALQTGCGGRSLRTISGTVTFDGVPVESGSMLFTPQGEGTTEGCSIVDGKYSATISPGVSKVDINASKPHPTKTTPNVEPDKPPVPAMVEYNPDIYNAKTTLTVDTSEGSTHNFELKTPEK